MRLRLLTPVVLLLSATAVRAQNISTVSAWDGSSFTRSFGYQNTATYGQTFTAPSGALTSFSFFLSNISSTTPITDPSQLPFKAYVFGWDLINTHATGSALFTSAVAHGTTNTGFDRYDFAVPSLSLSPGATYVAFLSTSAFGALTPATNAMATEAANPYAGGQFVFLNNGADPSQWTTGTWTTNFCGGAGCDAVFEAKFATSVTTTPEPSSLALLASGIAGVVGAAWRRRTKSA